MKHIKTRSVSMPWYVAMIAVYSYEKDSLSIGFWPAARFYGKIIWWAFPIWMHGRQMSECKDYIPDYVAPGGREATGNKVKPLFGFVIRTQAGDIPSWRWWESVEKFTN